MDRYNYAPGELSVSVDLLRDDDVVTEFLDIGGYKIFDSRAGHTDDVWIAFTRDVDVAQRLVGLLNADELARQMVPYVTHEVRL